MKRFRSLNIILPVLLAIAMLSGFADAASTNRNDDGGFLSNTITEKFELSAAGSSGMTIEIEHKFGDIGVTTGSGTTVRLVGEKKVASRDEELAQQFMDAMEVRIKERGNRLVIETYYPEKELSKRERRKIKKFNISYTIEIPDNVNFSLNSSFGNIDLDTLSGTFTVSNGFGKLSARHIQGNVELNNKFGALLAEKIDGSLEAYNEHGALDVSEISGELVAKNSFGKASVFNVKGDARVNNSHGYIEAEEIGGTAQLETSFGYLECSTVHGSATVRSSHGSVNLRNVKENATATTSFGKATVKNVVGNVTIDNQHGGIEIENVGGDVRAHTTFGSCHLTKVAGNVSVTNQHSSITAHDLLPSNGTSDRMVSLKTSHGTIKATFPEALSAQVDAIASFGKFRSDFPVLVTMQGTVKTSSNQTKISGTIGDGSDTVELEGTHGNVYMEKSVTDNWKLSDVFPEMDSL